jgi:hypothetical protein
MRFGNSNVGEPGPASRVTLTNIGSGPLTISSLTASADFRLSDNCANPLAGGASCTISLQFDPIATGSRSGTLTLVSNSIVHPELVLPLSGNGTAPGATVFPAALSFDAQMTGTVSSAQTVTLTNPGSGPLTVSSIVATGDFTETSNCPSMLASLGGCTLQVMFKPTATGTRSGSLTIFDDAVPAGTHQSGMLSGNGTLTAAAFTLAPESLFFPGQEIQTSSPAQVVTLTNHSGASVSLGAPGYSAGYKGTTT